MNIKPTLESADLIPAMAPTDPRGCYDPQRMASERLTAPLPGTNRSTGTRGMKQ